ncbi:hypothetical protein yc1106_07643 [Curvularia clavata]|uniref:Uncharacterized protein n=1 Tax=Curvularia clavata TaxID=95742 RepID=A0A9Q8ZD22_CURCL|nr:hypothetical protein yc1106_07643 [Curvularia clavata]
MSHAVSTHYQIPQPSFARLCQAALYVDRAIAFTRNQQPMSNSRIAELTVLADELCAFCAVLDSTPPKGYLQDGFLSLLAPQCMARSALFIILDPSTCPEKIGTGAGYITSTDAKTSAELNLQAYSINIIQQVSQQAQNFIKEIMSMVDMEAQLGRVSPFILHYMYCTIATFYWFLGENGKESYQARIYELGMFLEKMGTRWKLAEKYMELVKFYDVSERSRNFPSR